MTLKKELNSENFSFEIVNFLENNKAQKIVNFSLKKKSNEADFMIIASGSSKRQVSSLSEKMVDYVKTNFKKKARTEGLGNSDWVLIDFGDIIVHIFREEVRDFYELEKIWDSNNLKILNYENKQT
tara:strand:- start:120 stop:497 length:378 start_codon:yes stop_codon:yes gene_type:complete